MQTEEQKRTAILHTKMYPTVFYFFRYPDFLPFFNGYLGEVNTSTTQNLLEDKHREIFELVFRVICTFLSGVGQIKCVINDLFGQSLQSGSINQFLFRTMFYFEKAIEHFILHSQI